MTTVQPIPVPDQKFRNPFDLTWHNTLPRDDDDDSLIDSDSEASESFSSHESKSSSCPSLSDQEDDLDSSSVFTDSEEEDQSSSSEGGRPAESFSNRNFGTTFDLLWGSVTDMTLTDNVAFIAWLVPLVGISTMLITEFLACTNHFDCSNNYPTLSYAATFRPEGYAFTGGMCVTAISIFVSISLFFWYVRLRIKRQQKQFEDSSAKQLAASYGCLVFGVITAISLSGLAVMDMRAHHDAHINFTIIFFISSWIMMIAVQIVRKHILHENQLKNADGKVFKSDSLLVLLRRRSFWLSLRRWRRLDCFTAYTLGRLMLNIGLASTGLFGVFFLCANGIWPNPLGFTAVQEAFFEALAIVCQLLFMGTLSCESARLTRLVEHSDYMELERSE